MSNIVILALIILVVAILWRTTYQIWKNQNAGKSNGINNSAQNAKSQYNAFAILTPNEVDFFQKLKCALPELKERIYPQVSFSAFLAPALSRSNPLWLAKFHKINQKRCDFLIVDEIFKPLLIIECDDPSHNDRTQQDFERDRMVLSAGIKTLRLWNGDILTPADIRLRIGHIINLVQLENISVRANDLPD